MIATVWIEPIGEYQGGIEDDMALTGCAPTVKKSRQASGRGKKRKCSEPVRRANERGQKRNRDTQAHEDAQIDSRSSDQRERHKRQRGVQQA